MKTRIKIIAFSKSERKAMPLRARFTAVPARQELVELSLKAGIATSFFALSFRLLFLPIEKLDEFLKGFLGRRLLLNLGDQFSDLLLLELCCLGLGLEIVSDLDVRLCKFFEPFRFRLLLLRSRSALLRFSFLGVGLLSGLGH